MALAKGTLKLQLFDKQHPIYTEPRTLPPTKVWGRGGVGLAAGREGFGLAAFWRRSPTAWQAARATAPRNRPAQPPRPVPI
jgi:hypothetical protein